MILHGGGSSCTSMSTWFLNVHWFSKTRDLPGAGSLRRKAGSEPLLLVWAIGSIRKAGVAPWSSQTFRPWLSIRGAPDENHFKTPQAGEMGVHWFRFEVEREIPVSSRR